MAGILSSLFTAQKETEIPSVQIDARFFDAVDRKISKLRKVARQIADANRPEAGFELIQSVLDQSMIYFRLAVTEQDDKKKEIALLLGLGLLTASRDVSEILMLDCCKKHNRIISRMVRERLKK